MAVSEFQRNGMTRGAIAREVLPWADPYVAGLIKKLQEEVRAERQAQALMGRFEATGSEATAV
jgi:hypothetical protein